ncbi:platelet endothelial aggregation receptor 1-like isoform X1 [Saccostrea cucullata]|uniref:platelet endothelial aggregation receptor 1-like isoform X1 n=1 Tax=Saccostrea cuccullata TaxID=36930 RepID=UPI002ED1A377
MEILFLLMFCFSFVEPQVSRTIRIVPFPQSPFFREPFFFRPTRSRWFWQRCFQYPWMPRCQRLFGRRNERINQQSFPQNIRWQPFQGNSIIGNQNPRGNFRPSFPGNFRPAFPGNFGPIPDISQLQPVCNISCARGLKLVAGECHDIGADSLCSPGCSQGFKCHHGNCVPAPCHHPCSNGLTCRDGKCLDVGRCQPTCCPGQVCYRGRCLAENEVPREPQCNPPCPPGYVCHDGHHCDKVPTPKVEKPCVEPCPPGYYCHDGHCDLEGTKQNTCPVPCVSPEVCHNGHCEIDAHTLTHLTNPNIDHTHDQSRPGATGQLIPIPDTHTGHDDHHHEGQGTHNHHHSGGQVGGAPGRQVTDFFTGFRESTPGAFGAGPQQPQGGGFTRVPQQTQAGRFGTQQNSGFGDIHARIASEFRQSNVPDSQLGIDLSSVLFQDPVTGQRVNVNP